MIKLFLILFERKKFSGSNSYAFVPTDVKCKQNSPVSGTSQDCSGIDNISNSGEEVRTID
jgi:hypothetical protein